MMATIYYDATTGAGVAFDWDESLPFAPPAGLSAFRFDPDDDLGQKIADDPTAFRIVTGELHDRTGPVPLDLVTERSRRWAEIDTRTADLIAAGFVFDGHTFSLSASAQMNWTNLMISAALLPYPVAVSTADDGQYTLPTTGAVQAFYATGIGAVKAILDAGRVLKLAVGAATTKAAIDAVVDNR